MGFNRQATNNANRKPKDFTFHISQDDLVNKIQNINKRYYNDIVKNLLHAIKKE